MTNNDALVLRHLLTEYRKQRAPGLSEQDFFEIFVAEKILSDFDPSDDEVNDGITDNGDDGGIDSMYIAVDNRLVDDSFEPTGVRRNCQLELIIIQSKRKNSFEEAPIDRLIASTATLLDLSTSPAKLRANFNSLLYDRIELFRGTHAALTSRFPKLKISIRYACLGDQPNVKIHTKANVLKRQISSYFPSALVDVTFYGSAELYDLAKRATDTDATLPVPEGLLSAGSGYIALVRLDHFASFLTDHDGSLKKQFFEANVRDYQGNVDVNEAIRGTLADNTDQEFWWLNNGITIVASEVYETKKELQISEVQIVNGLQTSREIYEHFHNNDQSEDSRKVLVRVIQTNDDAMRTKVITATNSQTTIPSASLRSLDRIHRLIETYFVQHGFYYDRRKNYYKNQNKPRHLIVSIPYLAQAFTAIILRRPELARARPSSLLKNEDTYKQIFSEDYPVSVYLACAQFMKRIDDFLRDNTEIERQEIGNIRYQFAMFSAICAVGTRQFTGLTFPLEDLEKISDADLKRALTVVTRTYAKLAQEQTYAGKIPQISKAGDFTKRLLSKARVERQKREGKRQPLEHLPRRQRS